MDTKEMLEGFLRYLQSYYGGQRPYAGTKGSPNIVKIPLFQSGDAKVPEMPDMAMQMNQLFGQGQQPGMGMGMDAGMGMGMDMGMADRLMN
jgi:hypothetical protein